MFYMEWTLWGGGSLKYNVGHCQRGGGALKKHKDMRGGLEKNTSTKEGVPRKKMQNGKISSTPPLGINNDRSLKLQTMRIPVLYALTGLTA